MRTTSAIVQPQCIYEVLDIHQMSKAFEDNDGFVSGGIVFINNMSNMGISVNNTQCNSFEAKQGVAEFSDIIRECPKHMPPEQLIASKEAAEAAADAGKDLEEEGDAYASQDTNPAIDELMDAMDDLHISEVAAPLAETIQVVRMHPFAKLPTCAHGDNVGYDVYTTDSMMLQPGQMS
ncbi:hypothetical protein FBU31_004008 [Coemansia sp. 'formosensis']|nr:hypothetical protein FBU31_004008 [Coemansia sp. 'formosensis']